jgi:hypothetical protein
LFPEKLWICYDYPTFIDSRFWVSLIAQFTKFQLLDLGQVSDQIVFPGRRAFNASLPAIPQTLLTDPPYSIGANVDEPNRIDVVITVTVTQTSNDQIVLTYSDVQVATIGVPVYADPAMSFTDPNSFVRAVGNLNITNQRSRNLGMYLANLVYYRIVIEPIVPNARPLIFTTYLTP